MNYLYSFLKNKFKNGFKLYFYSEYNICVIKSKPAILMILLMQWL